MSRLMTVLLITVMMLSSSLMFSACSIKGGDGDASGGASKKKPLMSENDFDNPAYNKEQDGAEIVTAPHDEEDFVGSWVAPSDYAEHLYGNVSLRIFSTRTWTGVITDEKFNGKWKPDGTGIVIEDSQGLIKWRLFYVDDGSLMFEDLNKEGNTLVLMPTK